MKQTNKLIQATFIELVKKKPVDKITVKEIVDRCGINRNSFYYHYEDLPNLIESIFEDLVDEKISIYYKDGIQAVLLATAQSLEEMHDFCHNIYYSKNRDILIRRISQALTRLVEECLDQTYLCRYSISDEDRAIIIQLYRMEVCGFIMDWLQSGMNYDLTHHLGRMLQLRAGTLENMLEIAQQTRLSTNPADYHLK